VRRRIRRKPADTHLVHGQYGMTPVMGLKSAEHDLPFDVPSEEQNPTQQYPVQREANAFGRTQTPTALAAIPTPAPFASSPSQITPFPSSPSQAEHLNPFTSSPSQATPLQLTAHVPRSSPSQVGSLGKYRLIRPLAMGGMAQLFLAASEGPGGFSKKCALKVILPEFAMMSDFTAMFINEARVSAMLHHPNIVEVYDFGCQDERYFIAMEFIDGCSLEQLSQRCTAAVTIGLQVCDAMCYVQTLTDAEGRPLNLVHRDLSPDNILLSSSGLAKVSDFGIVKSEVNLNSTVAGVLKGKCAYMSPEQARSLPLDARSDIFSLCAALYEVSTGVSLFKRETMSESMDAVVNAEIKRPTELVPGFPSGLEHILLKGLSRDRNQRFQSFIELGDALEAFLTSQQWTSSTRELAALVQQHFPNAGSRGGTHIGLRTHSAAKTEPAAVRVPTEVVERAAAQQKGWSSFEVFLLVAAVFLAFGILLTVLL
jgi:eukaryotic-like serine/threonine-protein kinase